MTEETGPVQDLDDRIRLGSWVVHPEYGFAQVWDVFDPEARQEFEEKLDDDVVLIATGTRLAYVRLDALRLADMGEDVAS